MAKPRMTTDQFIERARERYGDRFAYDRCAYKNMKTHVCITCPEHGDVMVHPESFLVKVRHGCPKCGMRHAKKPPQYTTESLIAKYRAIWGEEFDYSEVVYEAWEEKVKIRHRECGRVMWQVPGSHFRHGCLPCSAKRRGALMRLKSKRRFLQRARAIHGQKYEYDVDRFSSMKAHIEVKCLKHKTTFCCSPNNHLHPTAPTGCPACAMEERRSALSMGVSEFAAKAQAVHGDFYGYDLVEYTNNKGLVAIRCPEHGVFMQSPDSHLRKSGCPLCTGSRMERRIAQALTRWRVDHRPQHSFPDCRRLKPLPFDFAILSPDSGVCGVIEHHGDQHFQVVEYFGGEEAFSERQENDATKSRYCHEQGIPLLTTTSDDDGSIESVLRDFCQSLGVL